MFEEAGLSARLKQFRIMLFYYELLWFCKVDERCDLKFYSINFEEFDDQARFS